MFKYIDQFIEKLTRPTVVVLDNATIHRSTAFKGRQTEWKAEGLTIYFLPTYSSELNLIEIVWRFIKYRWISLSAFLNSASFEAALANILESIDSDQYRISFV